MKNIFLNRIIFFVFWLYFFAFRGLLGMRILDYISISLVPIGIIMLILTNKESLKTIKWVSFLAFPLFISIIVDPSIYIIFIVIKIYLVAVYFVMYFKVMRINNFELICFTMPVFISVYYFIQPRPEDYEYLMKGRLTGISEPNFTSMSLIICLSGALSIHKLSNRKIVKLIMITIILICFWGVLLTASRAGFFAIIIIIILLPFLKVIKWHKALVALFFIILVSFNSDIVFEITNKLFVFERIQTLYTKHDSLIEAVYEERPFTASAFDTVVHDEWFVGGGPLRVSEWSLYNRVVPHNSFLDIGLEFGRASFYFYSLLFFIIFLINLSIILKTFKHSAIKNNTSLISPMFFLSLTPMFFSLSAGMTLIFIFWMTLGTYPLLIHLFKFPKIRI